MPQILILIVFLIVRLAAEGLKESSKNNAGSYSMNAKHRYNLRNTNSLQNEHQSERPTIEQAVSMQRSKPQPKTEDEYAYDEFENYDSDDYETFTKDECFEEEGHFVESQVKTYSTFEQRTNKIKFLIYTLVYCMWEDDDEITRKEKRMFNTISRAVTFNLSERDSNEVKGFINQRITLEDVVQKQHEYQLDLVDVVETISSLRKHLKREKQYNEILKVVESRFQYEL